MPFHFEPYSIGAQCRQIHQVENVRGIELNPENVARPGKFEVLASFKYEITYQCHNEVPGHQLNDQDSPWSSHTTDIFLLVKRRRIYGVGQRPISGETRVPQ